MTLWRVRAAPGASKAQGNKRNGQPENNPKLPHLYEPPSTPVGNPRTIQQMSETKRCSENHRRNVLPYMARAVLRRGAKPVGPAGRRPPSPRSSGVSEIPASSGNFRQPMRQKKREAVKMPASTRQKEQKAGASG